MEVTASRIRRPLLEAPDTVLLGVASRPALRERAAPGDVRAHDDRQTTAWMKEVALLEREAPHLARVDFPEPPFRWIAV